MTPEVARRFRLALLGYVILVVAAVAAFAISYAQQHEIKHNEQTIQRSTERLSVLLAQSGYQICLQTRQLQAAEHVTNNRVDCDQLRASADDIYRLLIK